MSEEGSEEWCIVLSATPTPVWTSVGIHTDAPFMAISYRDVFVEHLHCPTDFINQTKKHGLFENICEKLYNRGR
jgi:hypothetical protein